MEDGKMRKLEFWEMSKWKTDELEVFSCCGKSEGTLIDLLNI